MPRTYKSIGDAVILDRLRDGTLTVNIQTGTVYSYGVEITPEYDRRGYKFVRIYFRGSRKKIAVHRLVWTAATGGLIPDGHEAHHKKWRWDNSIGNLECLSADDHFFVTYGYRRAPAGSQSAVDEFMRS